MSNRIAITVYVDIPDGIVPEVEYRDTPIESATVVQVHDQGEPKRLTAPAPDYQEPPHPAETTRRPPPARQARAAEPYDATAPHCPDHQTEKVYFEPGINKKGKPYSASWRCPVSGCDNVEWLGDRR